jgi:hypothetical protein
VVIVGICATAGLLAVVGTDSTIGRAVIRVLAFLGSPFFEW